MRRILVVLFLLAGLGFAFSEEDELLTIPGGSFLMGDPSLKDLGVIGEKIKYTPVKFDQHSVTISSFQVSKFPITVMQFYKFVKEKRTETKGFSDYRLFQKRQFKKEISFDDYWNRMLARFSQYPAEVTFFEALAYCDWRGKRDNCSYRLPTEAEWEYIATGGRAQRYPWGTDYRQLENEDSPYWDPKRYSYPVGTFAEDSSSFGVRDVYANTPEWTLDCFDPLSYVNLKTTVNPISVLSPEEDLRISVRKVNASYRKDLDSFGVKYRIGEGADGKYAFRILRQTEETELDADSDHPLRYRYEEGAIKEGQKISMYQSLDRMTAKQLTLSKSETSVSYLVTIAKDTPEGETFKFVVTSSDRMGWIKSASPTDK